ncbi:MAG: SRPBCC family protein, partial [Fimbriimonadaceae bacterium]|nr:SRPBCC family protein [Chitinophagales bacterium]
LHKWKLWSAWSPENDAPITFIYEGKEKGEGAIMKWKGKKMGAGRMEIINCEPYKNMQLEILFNNSGFRMQSYFELIPAKDTTHITWKMEGKIRRFGIAKIIGLLLPRWMGRDMQTGLKILRLICEKKAITN